VRRDAVLLHGRERPGLVGLWRRLSAHNDSTLDMYGDPVEKKIAEIVKNVTSLRFDASDLMPGQVGSGSEWKGFTDYFSGAADLDTVLKEIDASWPKQ